MSIMKKSSSFRTLLIVLNRYKAFTAILLVTLFLLLIRIPLGTFNNTSWIDAVGHIVLPGVGTALIYAWLVECTYLPKLSMKKIVLFCLLLGTGLEVGWEIIEFGVDQTFGLSWQLDNTDTMIDLISAVLGSTIAATIFVWIHRSRL